MKTYTLTNGKLGRPIVAHSLEALEDALAKRIKNKGLPDMLHMPGIVSGDAHEAPKDGITRCHGVRDYYGVVTLEIRLDEVSTAAAVMGRKGGKAGTGMAKSRGTEGARKAAAARWSEGWTCIGSVRGGCGHIHQSEEAAAKCLARDQQGCKSQGGYSDRAVKRVTVTADGGFKFD